MNNGTFINQSSQYNDYKKLIYDFSPSKFKKQYDEDFYFDDNKNVSNNIIYSPINEFTTIKEYLKHRSDIIENLGYDYQNNGILNKTLSKSFFIEDKRAAIIDKIDKLFIYMANHIKSIKKTYNYMFEKNYVKFN